MVTESWHTECLRFRFESSLAMVETFPESTFFNSLCLGFGSSYGLKLKRDSFGFAGDIRPSLYLFIWGEIFQHELT